MKFVQSVQFVYPERDRALFNHKFHRLHEFHKLIYFAFRLVAPPQPGVATNRSLIQISQVCHGEAVAPWLTPYGGAADMRGLGRDGWVAPRSVCLPGDFGARHGFAVPELHNKF